MTFDVNLGNDIFLTYGTPVLRTMVPNHVALNAGLKRILLEQEAAHPELRTGGRSHSNQGGWRSNADLLDWPGAEIGVLQNEIARAIARIMQLAVGNDPDKPVRPELSLVAWANINRNGDYNVMHNHAGNHWSGAYYVSLGEPDPERAFNGFFEFYDPRPAAGMVPVPGFNFGLTLPVAPEEGMMMVFPSWHLHAVHPFFGTGERISISFNALVKRLDQAPG